MRKSLPEYLISQGALSLSSSYNLEHVNIPTQKDEFLTEHLNLSVRPLFLLFRTPEIPSQKTHFRTSFLQNSFQWLLPQMSVIFLKTQKQKQFSIPPLCLILLKSCNCIKIKILFTHKSEKNRLYLTSLIKELIKHENKFIRKVFHDRANSENRFSEFSYFMKGFKRYIMNILSVVYRMKQKCSERNISQCFLALSDHLSVLFLICMTISLNKPAAFSFRFKYM